MNSLRIRFSGLALLTTDPRLDVGSSAASVKSVMLYLPDGHASTPKAHRPTLLVPAALLPKTTVFDRGIAVWDSGVGAFRQFALWFLDRKSVSFGPTSDAAVTLRHDNVEPVGSPKDPHDPAEWSPLNWIASLSHANGKKVDLTADCLALKPPVSAAITFTGGTLTALPPMPTHRTHKFDYGAYKTRAFTDTLQMFFVSPDTTKPIEIRLTHIDTAALTTIQLDPRTDIGECFITSFESVTIDPKDADLETGAHVEVIHQLLTGSPTVKPVTRPDVDPVFCFVGRL